MKLVELEKVCFACPSAWEGKTDKGEEFYARFRWGKFRAELNGVTFYEKDLGDGYDGLMETDEMIELLGLEVDQDLIDKNMTDWDQISKNIEEFVRWHEELENNK